MTQSAGGQFRHSIEREPVWILGIVCRHTVWRFPNLDSQEMCAVMASEPNAGCQPIEPMLREVLRSWHARQQKCLAEWTFDQLLIGMI